MLDFDESEWSSECPSHTPSLSERFGVHLDGDNGPHKDDKHEYTRGVLEAEQGHLALDCTR